MKLSEEQRQVMDQVLVGKNAVLAGPGSGKTLMLVERLKQISNKDSILCLTFTRNAAREMAERSRVSADFRTLDSLAYQYWKEHGWKLNVDTKRAKIMSNRDMLELAREVVKDVLPVHYSPSSFLKRMLREKRLVEYQFLPAVDPNDWFQLMKPFPSDQEEEYYELACLYEKRKLDLNLWEFEDIERFVLESIEAGYFIVETEDLSVDEAHDLSVLQLRLLDYIDCRDFFLIASPEQSIYGFRQARPEYLENQIHKWHMGVHRLTGNFRSAQKIVALANKLYNCSVATRDNRGLVMDIGHFQSLSAEAKTVVSMLDDRDTGILARCNMQVVYFIMELIDRKKRYWTAKSILDKISLKLVDQFLRASGGDRDALAYVARTMRMRAQAVETSALRAAEADDAKLAIAYFRKAIGLDSWLAVNLWADEDYEDEMWLLDSVEDMGAGLTVAEFLSKLDNIRALEDPQSHIWVGTIHSAKGLEWTRVFLTGCTEGILPHAKGDAEEERRLFYVGVTRAKDELYLSSSRIRQLNTRSQYLKLVEEVVE